MTRVPSIRSGGSRHRILGSSRCSTTGPRRMMMLLLILFCWGRLVPAFPTYLLTKSGCMMDLSTDEVIMNAAVRAASESDDPTMLLHLAEDPPALAVSTMSRSSMTVPASSLPLTLQFQLGPAEGSPLAHADYQFTLETKTLLLPGQHDQDDSSSTTVLAEFQGGACEHQRRVAGRKHDIRTLQISALPADFSAETAVIMVWAGWATGQEAVRLTPAWNLTVTREGAPKKVEEAQMHPDHPLLPPPLPAVEDHGTAEKKISSWETFLVSDAGCAVDLTGHSLDPIQGHPVVSVDRKLEIQGAVAGSIPAEVHLALEMTTPEEVEHNVVVLHCTPGAKFEQGACQGQRVVVPAGSTAWPPLTLYEQRDVYVYALYAGSAEPGPMELRRTPPLDFLWSGGAGGGSDPHQGVGVPPESKNKEEPKAEQADPIHHKPEQEQIPPLVEKVQKDQYAQEQVDRQRLVEDKMREHMDVRRQENKIREQRAELDARGGEARKVLLLNRLHGKDDPAHHRHALGGVTPQGRGQILLLSRDLSWSERLEAESFSWSGYYWGLAVYIGAHALTIQCCLFASRRASKGRRDL